MRLATVFVPAPNEDITPFKTQGASQVQSRMTKQTETTTDPRPESSTTVSLLPPTTTLPPLCDPAIVSGRHALRRRISSLEISKSKTYHLIVRQCWDWMTSDAGGQVTDTLATQMAGELQAFFRIYWL